MEGFENFIGFNPLTALFTLLNMVITFLILKKFLFKPVNKMIADRQQEIDDLYRDAETAKLEAETRRQDYETQLSQAKQTSAELVRTATAEANQRSDEILRQARQEANALREKAAADIALEKKKALNEAKGDISGLAMDIAEKVVQKQLDRDAQQELIEGFIRQLGVEQ